MYFWWNTRTIEVQGRIRRQPDVTDGAEWPKQLNDRQDAHDGRVEF